LDAGTVSNKDGESGPQTYGYRMVRTKARTPALARAGTPRPRSIESTLPQSHLSRVEHGNPEGVWSWETGTVPCRPVARPARGEATPQRAQECPRSEGHHAERQRKDITGWIGPDSRRYPSRKVADVGMVSPLKNTATIANEGVS
jgi:hypothetical protein